MSAFNPNILLEIQGLADGITRNAEEIYEYDAEDLAKELIIILREIRQVLESAKRLNSD